jgi:hypothetical protein
VRETQSRFSLPVKTFRSAQAERFFIGGWDRPAFRSKAEFPAEAAVPHFFLEKEESDYYNRKGEPKARRATAPGPVFENRLSGTGSTDRPG